MWKKDTLQEACRRFKGEENSLKPLRNTYQYQRDGTTCILKLVPHATRDVKVLTEELEWISFLRENDIQIPASIPSSNGKWIEVIHKLPFPCCVISFEKPKGHFINIQDPSEWNKPLFMRWGRILGKIHSLSHKFMDKHASFSFVQWNEGEIYDYDLTFAGEKILERWNGYLHQFQGYPQTKDSYGLIHNHLTHDNFLIDDKNKLVLFDFPDCKFHYFTYDIAISVYHACTTVPPSERLEFKKMFLHSFMAGYQVEHQLEMGWREQVDVFIEFRYLFTFLHDLIFLNPVQLSEEKKQWLNHTRAKLEQGQSFFAE
jgi:amicoumacin kinase